MTSMKQFEANCRDSLKSTGPKTEAGKQASRCNAVRHGLTAETVIGALEDAEDYKAFELAITADYDAQSAVERELVLGLASLLWRLRRATTIETGLFEIQAEHLSDFRKVRQISPASREIVYALFNANSDRQAASHGVTNTSEMSLVSRLASTQGRVAPGIELARCFCGSVICPIMPSTASAAMKPLFGVKLGAFWLRSTIWIAASRMRECGVRLEQDQGSSPRPRQWKSASRSEPQGRPRQAEINSILLQPTPCFRRPVSLFP
jgi:hypothetical protein